MTDHPTIGTVAMGDSNNLMAFFSENVDRWGAVEWFDRLAKAIREQDKAVRAMYQSTGDDKVSHEIMFETYRNIASSSAMQLVRDYEQQVRAALAAPQPAHGTSATERAPTDDTVERVAKALAVDMYPDTRWPSDEADANSGIDDRDGRHPISWHFANKCRSQARVAIFALATPTPKEESK